MKSILRLKQLTFVVLATTLLSSCLKGEDPVFQVAGRGATVIQKNTVVSGEVEKSFIPFIQVLANDAIENYTCEGPNGVVSMERMEGITNGVRSRIFNSYFSSTYPKGTYKVTLTNTQKETISTMVDIKDNDTYLGTIDAKITFENDRVKATWNKVDNADLYIVGLAQKNNPYILNSGKEFRTYPESGVEFPISDIARGFSAGEYRLVVRAVQTSADLVLDSESLLITLK